MLMSAHSVPVVAATGTPGSLDWGLLLLLDALSLNVLSGWQAVEMAEKPTVVAVKEEGSGELIYIGFEKGDYAPRTGRKGRFITADPSQYPDRTPLTGGWPGGEAGLKAWVEVGPGPTMIDNE